MPTNLLPMQPPLHVREVTFDQLKVNYFVINFMLSLERTLLAEGQRLREAATREVSTQLPASFPRQRASAESPTPSRSSEGSDNVTGPAASPITSVAREKRKSPSTRDDSDLSSTVSNFLDLSMKLMEKVKTVLDFACDILSQSFQEFELKRRRLEFEMDQKALVVVPPSQSRAPSVQMAQPVEHLCIACCGAPACMVLLDCGHEVLCTRCCDLVIECPMCRARITQSPFRTFKC